MLGKASTGGDINFSLSCFTASSPFSSYWNRVGYTFFKWSLIGSEIRVKMGTKRLKTMHSLMKVRILVKVVG